MSFDLLDEDLLAAASEDPSHPERDHDDQAHREQGDGVELDVEAGRDHDDGVQRSASSSERVASG